jgi:NADH dehydrogenase (ubiquinone) 1 beta subcomplex subunit 11
MSIFFKYSFAGYNEWSLFGNTEQFEHLRKKEKFVNFFSIFFSENMASLIRLNHILRCKNATAAAIRLISTSPKNRETATLQQEVKKEHPTTAINKNWVSYGFDFKDEAADRAAHKGSFFTSVTLCLVVGTLVWAYLPDPMLRDWAQREGFLELRRREAAGLDPVSKDYVDPSSVVLPSEEDLGAKEIII